MTDLSALLESSRALTSHLARRDLPSVNLSLDQIEAQSRRLVSRQPGTSTDNDRANYLLAQARVDAPALANSIAHLNASTTFSPLQPLHDTDVNGYLRHAHEQTLISTIEEGRRETQEEFYKMLEERGRRDWEARKKKIFERLGGRSGAATKINGDLRKSIKGGNSLSRSTAAPLSSDLQMQSKMLAYDQAILELNKARLREASLPIVHTLLKIAADISTDRASQIPQMFHTLSKITNEPPSPVPAETGAHVMNAPMFERKYSRVYLGDPNSTEAASLRKQIAKGAKEALEIQYWDIMERTIQSRPTEARLGGDPSVANKVRAFLLLRFYRSGDWEERIELVASQPLWTKLFYMVRTGHVKEAVAEAISNQRALEHREPSFVTYFKTWAESPDGRLPKSYRDQIQSLYNTHMLNSSTADPFKLALFRLMGKLDPQRRSIPLVTTTTEDWLWFQLAMVDEDDDGGLRGLAQVLMSYGESHFEGPPTQRRTGMWANVLLMCGEFERAVSALDEMPDTKVEAVHLAIALAYHGLLRIPPRAETPEYDILWVSGAGIPALNLGTLIRRYIRPFIKHDSHHALQYIASVCLSADQQAGGVGKEQVDFALSEVKKVVVSAEGPGWDDLVGGLRPDGSRFAGYIEQMAPLFKIKDNHDYNEKIVAASASLCQRERRTLEAIKLYNIAGDFETVVACLAQALGECVSQPDAGGEEGKKIEITAREISHHYSRLNRAAGKARDAIHMLLKIRDATTLKAAGRLDAALEAMDSTGLVPLEGDAAKLNRRAAEFEASYDDSVKRNLPVYLPLTMELLSELHAGIKGAAFNDVNKKMRLESLRKRSRALVMFAGLLRFRMLPEVYAYLARLDVEIAL